MSHDSAERSTYSGAPWEAYWFSWGAMNCRNTSGDKARTISGQTYEPAAIRRTEVSQSQELSSGSIQVEIPVDHPVAKLFVGFLPPQPVSLVIYRGHEGETETVTSYTGMVSSAKFGETCELTVVREQDALKRPVPAVKWQTQCPRQLFSKGCGVSKLAYLTAATIDSVAGTTVKSSQFAAKPNDYFRAGWIEAHGTCMAILSHTGDTVVLFYPLAGLQPGDVAPVYPGCQGTEDDCENKFNNIPNHLGCARIPSENPFGEGGIA